MREVAESLVGFMVKFPPESLARPANPHDTAAQMLYKHAWQPVLPRNNDVNNDNETKSVELFLVWTPSFTE